MEDKEKFRDKSYFKDEHFKIRNWATLTVILLVIGVASAWQGTSEFYKAKISELEVSAPSGSLDKTSEKKSPETRLPNSLPSVIEDPESSYEKRTIYKVSERKTGTITYTANLLEGYTSAPGKTGNYYKFYVGRTLDERSVTSEGESIGSLEVKKQLLVPADALTLVETSPDSIDYRTLIEKQSKQEGNSSNTFVYYGSINDLVDSL